MQDKWDASSLRTLRSASIVEVAFDTNKAEGDNRRGSILRGILFGNLENCKHSTLAPKNWEMQEISQK